MAAIVMTVFGGMVPRRGEQHLEVVSASDAENTLLYSGELRALNRPSIAHRFAQPGDRNFVSPALPPGQQPTVPGDPIPPDAELGYSASALHDKILELEPAGYWPMDDASADLVTDVSGNLRNLAVYGTSQAPQQASLLDDETGRSWRSNANAGNGLERIGRPDVNLVPINGHMSMFAVVGPIIRNSEVFRVNTSNSSYWVLEYLQHQILNGESIGRVVIRLYDDATPGSFGYHVGDIEPNYDMDTHTMGVVWDETFGAWQVYVDGVHTGGVSSQLLPVGGGPSRVFSISAAGESHVQYVASWASAKSGDVFAALHLAYQRNFLDYVTPTEAE